AAVTTTACRPRAAFSVIAPFFQVGVALWPSIVAVTDCGSTPDPASVAATTMPPAVDFTRSVGGLVSFVQNRKVNGPGFLPSGVSNTTSYVPAVGSTRPAIGREAPYCSRYGLRSIGRPV